jgi:hypothetical protein
MTIYGFNLSLDEQELWAIKEAMEFYLTSEATELRKNNPHLVKYAASIKLHELLASGKLYSGMQLISTNSFGKNALQVSTTSASEESLFTTVIKQLRSNPQLLSLVEMPIKDMFIEHPTLNQLILDSIVECLNNTDAKIKFDSKNLLEDDKARNLFCDQISLQLYKELAY